MSNNSYKNMSALTALRYAQNHILLLPDIQREYVWDLSEIERLFESIVDNYPIGSCIFWKTNKQIINSQKPNLYYFIREYVQGKSKNEKAPEIIQDENDYYVVLDGQQRITSMYIALFGSYTCYKGGKGNIRSNPKSWIKKELFYNLSFYDTYNEDDERPSKRFVFLTKEESETGNYFKIKKMLAYDRYNDFYDSLIENNIMGKSKEDLSLLYSRLNSSEENNLIHYYCIDEEEYDNALNIFVRVNSTGKKLSKSDLLFSTLIDGWKEGKEEIENILSIMNGKGEGFKFSRDFLMRACLVLTDANTNLKIESLNRNTIFNIRDNWGKIKSCMEKMVDVLVKIGISNETLTSYNATMPIIYYLFKNGKIETADDLKETQKFLLVSLAKRLFGIASNAALNITRNVLKLIDCRANQFSLKLFYSISLVGSRNFKIDEKDIDYWLDNYQKGQDTFILLSLLYPELKFNQIIFHQDHCHPYAGFEKKSISYLNLSDEKIEEWKRKRNLLPNLQFLEGTENESKNKTPLKQWVAKGNDFKYHPEQISLDLKEFDLFFSSRREMMKLQLKKIFDLE